MAKMLRATGKGFSDYGHCDFCASGQALHMKPGPRERHQARQREKRQWKRDARREGD